MVNDVIRMQQEAEQRVQQMRERSRLLVSGVLPEGGRTAETMAAGRPRPRTFPIHTQPPPGPPPEPPPREPESCLEKKEKAGGLGGLFQDQEQLFLLMLAVLLIKNGAQMEIVLALLYIAM